MAAPSPVLPDRVLWNSRKDFPPRDEHRTFRREIKIEAICSVVNLSASAAGRESAPWESSETGWGPMSRDGQGNGTVSASVISDPSECVSSAEECEPRATAVVARLMDGNLFH